MVVVIQPSALISGVMPSGLGIGLLSVVWTVSVIGAVFKFGHWRRGDTVGTALYAAVSGLAALALPALWIRGGVAPAVLYLVAGSLYIFGARWFAKTWPRLRPAVFSYHEVWHVFTVAAAALHFAADERQPDAPPAGDRGRGIPPCL